MGHIGIRDLEIFAHHGVYPEENEKGQNFLDVYKRQGKNWRHRAFGKIPSGCQ